MFRDLLLNALILISFTLIYGIILNEIPKKVKENRFYPVLLGIAGGLLGILIMENNIGIRGTDVIIDMRLIIVMMIECIGGTVPVLITALMLAIFRISYNGINEASMISQLILIFSLLAIFFINHNIRNKVRKWFLKLGALWFVWTIIVTFLLRGNENLVSTNLFFTVVFLSVGSGEYFFLDYIRRSNMALEMYKENAAKDFLTGLHNTRSFDQLINSSFQAAIEKNEKLSCLMLDIDHFKNVNDTYGHAAGDVVLKELAEILRKNCRNFDVVGRIGGEEFCVLLLDCTNERSFEIGLRIKEAVKNHDFYIEKDRSIQITISIGTATYPDTVTTLDELRREADKALYIAKQTGRDKICDNQQCLIV